jgi:hypothetical protein
MNPSPNPSPNLHLNLSVITGRPSHKLNPLAGHPLFEHSAINRLVREFQRYLFLPDPQPLYALFGCLIANYGEGSPLWLMLVGPPSCGKSELIASLYSIPGILHSQALSGAGALLSGTRLKERAKDATGGLLRQIGPRGALTFKDFTSMLSLRQETLRELLAAFREIYDGRWGRQLGVDGARSLEWRGKLGIVGGCTEAIDRHSSLTSEMGERFLYYRFPTPTDRAFGQSNALVNRVDARLNEHLQAAVDEFLREIGVDWSFPAEFPSLERADHYRLIAWAQFASAARSAVERDPYRHEIQYRSSTEYPMRLTAQFSELLRSMRYIGVPEREAWFVIRKLAFDSIPGLRRDLLDRLVRANRTEADLTEHTECGRATVQRALGDLKMHKLVTRIPGPTTTTWGLTESTRECLRSALANEPWDEPRY